MKKITLLDIIITALFFVIILVIIATRFFYNSNSNSILFIESENGQYYYSLDQKKTIEIQGSSGITIIEIDNGKFSFKESSCPNKDCVKVGWVSLPNFPVICLPNKVSAYIVNDKDKLIYDGVSR